MNSPVLLKYKNRFDALQEELGPYFGGSLLSLLPGDPAAQEVSASFFLDWTTRAKSLVADSCGKNSEYYETFVRTMEPRGQESHSWVIFRLMHVFSGIKKDYQKGHVVPLVSMIRAEVFDDELGQADELLSHGYFPAAAVIAGAVLETFMRAQCDSRQLQAVSLNQMNAELSKAGVYDQTVQKKITFYSGVRNDAAHGKSVKESDVKQVIEGIRQHLRDYSI